jgi:RimJ/RimL family protein N-acetyltransferase
MRRIDLRVLQFNTRAIRAYEKCGFVQEILEPSAAFIDGQWHSDVIMAIDEQAYRAQHGSWKAGAEAR